ncbi:MAG: hypothetical protein KAH30_02850 [Caldisericia bacterium]|nr:hypothetical protein [Caldisericia bacterium]
MKNIAIVSVLIIMLCLVSCAQGDDLVVDTDSTNEMTNEIVVDDSNPKAINDLSENKEYTKPVDNVFRNEFVEFVLPDDWFVGKKDDQSVSIFPSMVEDITITGVSIQFIETEGYIDAKKYITMTASSSSGLDVIFREPNSNGLMFHEIKGIVENSDMINTLWQLSTDLKDGNIISISIASTDPIETDELTEFLDSIKVLK